MKKQALRFLLAGFVAALVSISARAEDFKKTYPISHGGKINIQNVSGDIHIGGYDGSVVSVTAVKEGEDPETVEIIDQSTGNSVDLRVKYNTKQSHSSVDFKVQVPRSMTLVFEKLNSASGDIAVEDVTGDIKASTASGDVFIRNAKGDIRANSASGDVKVENVSGTVNANTASGDVIAEITSLDGQARSMSFNTASGDVHVSVPADINAEVDMATMSGEVKTDFPLEVREPEHGVGSTAKGRLGSGGISLQLHTASGDIRLTHGGRAKKNLQ